MIQKLNNTQKKKKKGFTLVELIIVLAVMAILGAIAIPNLVGVKDKAAVKADEQSAQTIKRSIEVLVADGTATLPSADKTFTIEDNGIISDEQACKDAVGDKALSAIKNSLSGIKKPSEKDKDVYQVTVKTSGEIEVKSATKTKS